MHRIKTTSFIIFAICAFGVWSLHLATPLLTVLFSFLVLEHLNFKGRKWIAVLLYLVVVLGLSYGFGSFLTKGVDAIPTIIAESIPAISEFARGYNVDLPFSDVESLKVILVGGIKTELAYLANFAKVATKEFVFLIIGIVVAISIFLNSKIDLGSDDYSIKNNLYTILTSEIASRFRNFYESFSTVLGAQLVISGINTFFTSTFLYGVGLPYFSVLVAITFLCGLLPIIGNVISNTIIFAVAIKLSLSHAVGALVFLIVLHKFEYFLNSKIIGGRIKNPMWLTLLGLIVGERIMGVPGMILAPVILHFLKIEGSRIEIK